MDANTVTINETFEKYGDLFYKISREIWNNPELRFEEISAHRLLTNDLESLGFTTERNYVLPTGFKAEFSNNPKGPVVAILCEYDALPKIGHACGHNLIAEAGFAAAVAVKAVLEADSSIGGKVVVFGTPAEEGGGGKIHFIKAGALDDVDVAMMVHPARASIVFQPFIACAHMTAVFEGKSTHASASPWLGKNALDAAVNTYASIGLLRQQINPECRVGVIISKGGEAPNVIPSLTEMKFGIRTPVMSEMDELIGRIKSCCQSGAAAAGCSVTINVDEDIYDSLFSNVPLGKQFKKHADKLGLQFFERLDIPNRGSTDMGNVSQVIPSIHPLFGIGEASNHSVEFTNMAGTEEAHLTTLQVAKAMAFTCIDVFKDKELLNEIKKYFSDNK
ncbi:xaa-Arg dipeptidase-like [Centruroides vittatus]|uniref:xaa-Arg dipeptidase-like n=1 Tax=Centruroides vittatus TaxID=120091 RepID=UPI00351026F8